MVKLDEWLKDHTKADGDYFRNEKAKIDAKLKEARAKIVALAGDPGNKAREEKIKLQERIMELEHEERLRGTIIKSKFFVSLFLNIIQLVCHKLWSQFF